MNIEYALKRYNQISNKNVRIRADHIIIHLPRIKIIEKMLGNWSRKAVKHNLNKKTQYSCKNNLPLASSAKFCSIDLWISGGIGGGVGR